jgi:hypothetical protein
MWAAVLTSQKPPPFVARWGITVFRWVWPFTHRITLG